jgi:hypothetical protein
MMLLDILIQMVTDWIRDVFAEMLGGRIEEFVARHLKRRVKPVKRTRRQNLRKLPTAKRRR